MSAPLNKKPWPMKWIVIAILTFMAGYTFITLKYRKPGRASEPYQDAKDRETVTRLRQAGYVRVPATAERPADPRHTRATVTTARAEIKDAPGGLPPELDETLIDKPKLPETLADVIAPAAVSPMLPYFLQYTCLLPDHKKLLGETRVYVKDQHIAIVTDFEGLDGELLARTKESTVLLTLPASVFKSGETFDLTLIGAKSSKQWTVQVH